MSGLGEWFASSWMIFTNSYSNLLDLQFDKIEFSMTFVDTNKSIFLSELFLQIKIMFCKQIPAPIKVEIKSWSTVECN